MEMALRLLDHKILVAVAAVILVRLVFRLYNGLVAKPWKLRRMLREQGIGGPPQTFMLGNIREFRKAQRAAAPKAAAATGAEPIRHDCAGALFPFFEQWRKQYGEMFVFGLGNTQAVYVMKPEVVREITTCTSLDLGKPSYQQKQLGQLLGQGILTSNGAAWARQRKILAPELYPEKVKGMLGLINESTSMLVKSWKHHVETAGGVAEINVDEHMRSFSGDVISRACFGSNYAKGEKIFMKLGALQVAMSKKFLSASNIPGLRCLPTKNNRQASALEKEVRTLILQVVKERNEEATGEKQLLQMVLEAAKDSDLSQEAADQFIVDNCKNIYLAGFETTAVAATWCLMLLAANPDWQDRVRCEALEVCGGCLPDSEMLRKMKQLSMVIHESLRLYSPVAIISREALKDTKFGDFKVPEGMMLWSLVLALHTDPEIWGPDSYQFNPERFANGITGACRLPYLYMPFGVGPRVCLGQHLAMTELKILLSQIVCNFSFSLSPKYVHCPTFQLVILPKFGVDLLLKKL